MQFEIHFTASDGSDDCVLVAGNTIEEIREKADREVARRNGRDPWSREIIEPEAS